MMDKKNLFLVKSISCLLEAHKAIDESEQNEKDLSSIRYLLGQTIRAYKLPSQNIHISHGAYELWNKLTTSNIDNYTYRESVTCDKLTEEGIYKIYKGGSKTGIDYKIVPGGKFCFRDIFHVDHVIPVSFIQKELLNLKTINEEAIIAILNKMHLCRILKEEDRRLDRIANRTFDFNETIQNVYNKQNVWLK